MPVRPGGLDPRGGHAEGGLIALAQGQLRRAGALAYDAAAACVGVVTILGMAVALAWPKVRLTPG